ncbi:MAG: hypothetical protein AAGA54_34700 [Myxococcota bacterium]
MNGEGGGLLNSLHAVLEESRPQGGVGRRVDGELFSLPDGGQWLIVCHAERVERAMARRIALSSGRPVSLVALDLDLSFADSMQPEQDDLWPDEALAVTGFRYGGDGTSTAEPVAQAEEWDRGYAHYQDSLREVLVERCLGEVAAATRQRVAGYFIDEYSQLPARIASLAELICAADSVQLVDMSGSVMVQVAAQGGRRMSKVSPEEIDMLEEATGLVLRR